MADPMGAPRSGRSLAILRLQATNLGVAFALGFAAFHAHGGMVAALGAAGGAFGLIGLCTAGPLGVIHRLGRRANIRLTVAVGVALALSPLLVRHDLDAFGVGTAELGALVVLRLSLPNLRIWRQSAAAPAPATSSAPPSELGIPSIPTGEIARRTGRVVARLRRDISVASPVVSRAARRSARGLGRAAARGRSRPDR